MSSKLLQQLEYGSFGEFVTALILLSFTLFIIIGILCVYFKTIVIPNCNNHKRQRHLKIAQLNYIEYLFVSIMVIGIVYITGILLFNILIMFLRFEIACKSRIIGAALPAIQRMCLYSFFTLRLKQTFDDSALELSLHTFYCLLIIPNICVFCALLFYYLYILVFAVCDENALRIAILPAITNDLFWRILLTAFFVHKLRQMLRIYSLSYNSFAPNIANKHTNMGLNENAVTQQQRNRIGSKSKSRTIAETLRRSRTHSKQIVENAEETVQATSEEKLCQLMAKLTSIVFSSSVFTIVLYITVYFSGYLVSALCVDQIVTNVCIALTFKQSQDIYDNYICCLCHNLFIFWRDKQLEEEEQIQYQSQKITPPMQPQNKVMTVEIVTRTNVPDHGDQNEFALDLRAIDEKEEVIISDKIAIHSFPPQTNIQRNYSNSSDVF